MRVLHGPQNIGGMAGVLASAQRRLGVDAKSICHINNVFQYSADQVIPDSKSGVLSSLSFFFKEALPFDIFQFYFDSSWAGQALVDIPLLKKLGKKVYFYFCGCEIRDSKATIRKYKYSACKQCWPMLCSANRERLLEIATKYADGVFVSTPDLLEFVPNSVLLPQPIDVKRLNDIKRYTLNEDFERKANAPIKIGHAPSNQNIKGTKYLVRAVAALAAKGYPVELVLVEGKSYAEAMQTCARVDIIVDQLLVGAYGQFAVEMMAMGKPVVCFLRADLLQEYPTALPIISADIESIEGCLANLIKSRDSWPTIGARGREYVDAVHASEAVARKMLDTYLESSCANSNVDR
ncbi:hypothetical protein CJO09_07300 [Neopusillimonas maritima]|uniref:Glycosyl transferase family 1 domain-containing protein n=2 Tax=Neopusillimonas maritima TaxID=2026239 RepID=A0ABX9MY50_9BURK|nr:hypothetical protein CJO09_07300 [Neopusillimonas maritima]